MKRKRYIKLKMADGLSRNEAELNAREIVAEGLSYQEDFDRDAASSLDAQQAKALLWALSNWKEWVDTVEDAVASVTRVAQAFIDLLPSLLEGKNAAMQRIQDEKEG